MVVTIHTDFRGGINLTQSLYEVVCKGIVVIDHDYHGARFADDVNAKIKCNVKKIILSYQLKRSLASSDTVPIIHLVQIRQVFVLRVLNSYFENRQRLIIHS